MGGASLLLGVVPLVILLVLGLAFYALLASNLSYRAKVGGMTILAVLLMVGRGLEVTAVPAVVWPVLGALFMFRMMIYLYDLRQAKQRPSLQEYLAYFYPLPNFYFLLFPGRRPADAAAHVLSARHPRRGAAGIALDGARHGCNCCSTGSSTS